MFSVVGSDPSGLVTVRNMQECSGGEIIYEKTISGRNGHIYQCCQMGYSGHYRWRYCRFINNGFSHGIELGHGVSRHLFRLSLSPQFIFLVFVAASIIFKYVIDKIFSARRRGAWNG